MYVLANAHKDKVKITFFHGARLPDPRGLFNAGLDGNKWRAIDLREGDRLDEEGLRELLRAAIHHNQAHAVPRSKGSRAPRKSPPKAKAKAKATPKTKVKAQATPKAKGPPPAEGRGRRTPRA
jgi:hypothetical protein